MSKGTINYDPIITPAVLKEHQKQIKIIQDGQASDPNDRPMYIDVGHGNVIKFFFDSSENPLESKKIKK